MLSTMAALLGLSDEEVRQRFLAHFGDQIQEFEQVMTAVYERWQQIEEQFARDRDSATVVAVLFAVVARMLLSMKLLMSGHVTLSGAAKRQALEALAQGFLFAKRGLPYLKQAWEGGFSSNKAIGIAVRRHAELNLNAEALAVLVQARGFYNKLSHATIFAMCDLIDLDGTGSHLGASFDETKLPSYRDELTASLSLAKTLTNAIDCVAGHMREWPQPSASVAGVDRKTDEGTQAANIPPVARAIGVSLRAGRGTACQLGSGMLDGDHEC